VSGVPMYGESVARSTQRAGFWIRFAAALIDGIVVGIIAGVLAGVVHAGRPLSTLVSLVYLVAFFGHPRGQTPGFMATGLRVVSLAEGGPIGYSRAAIRWLVGLVSGVVILLGYLWMIWDPEKQTWHDKAAGSIVIRTTG
jgi:uncharacterized RDD family membrane protein YckC